MEIAIIILLAVLCLLVVGSCILLLRKGKGQKEILPKAQIEANQEMKMLITQMKESISSNLHMNMQEEILRLKGEFQLQYKETSNTLADFEREIGKRMDEKFLSLHETMIKRLGEINQKVNDSIQGGFQKNSEAYEKMIAQITIIEQARQNIETLSTQVVSLKQVLENNQQRGRFGELALERILHSVFGDTQHVYDVQYTLKNQERPDAVIFLPEPNKMLCIDSKFPFVDYRGILEADTKEQREQSKKGFVLALRKHITAVKNKYIIPETTAPQALLFIPSDAIFAYVHGEMPDVVDYARESNVVLTSPSTLQPILATLQLIRVQYERNKNIDTICRQLERLGKDFRSFGTEWKKFSTNIEKLEKSREDIDNRVKLIHKKFNAISDMSEKENLIDQKEEIKEETRISD